MKKTIIILLGLVLLLAGFSIWLVNRTNPSQLNQQEVSVDVQDTFEK